MLVVSISGNVYQYITNQNQAKENTVLISEMQTKLETNENELAEVKSALSNAHTAENEKQFNSSFGANGTQGEPVDIPDGYINENPDKPKPPKENTTNVDGIIVDNKVYEGMTPEEQEALNEMISGYKDYVSNRHDYNPGEADNSGGGGTSGEMQELGEGYGKLNWN